MPKKVFANIEERQLKLLYENGWTDAQVAKFFNVDRLTIYDWKRKHPDFKEKVKNWKDKADDPVEKTLYQKAVGKIKLKEIKTIRGEKYKVEQEIVTVKELPPCTTAIIFWLKNRKRTEWRDKVEIGGDDLNINVTRKEYKKK